MDRGSTVVVEVGYNDPPETFAERVEQAIIALRGAGVQRILWLTLHEAQPFFAGMNAALAAAAQTFPGIVTLVDWNAAARGHPDWFQDDGVHLLGPGAAAIAALINSALVQALAPPQSVPTAASITIDDSPLPVGKRGQRYSVRLRASGEPTQLVRWSLTSGPLIEGLHLRPDGLIFGVPRREGRLTLAVRAVDQDGRSATHLIHLLIAA